MGRYRRAQLTLTPLVGLGPLRHHHMGRRLLDRHARVAADIRTYHGHVGIQPALRRVGRQGRRGGQPRARKSAINCSPHHWKKRGPIRLYSNSHWRAGRSAFLLNCSQCHGTGATGAVGYPNLNDDDWLWGGALEDIHQTVSLMAFGRATTRARFNQMPGFLMDESLTREEVDLVTDHVLSLSGGEAASSEAGAELFLEWCAMCHAEDGPRERGARRAEPGRRNLALWRRPRRCGGLHFERAETA